MQTLPVVICSEHIRAPASQHGEHSGSQVSRWVDRVAAVVAEAESNAEYSETHAHRDQLTNEITSQNYNSQ